MRILQAIFSEKAYVSIMDPACTISTDFTFRVFFNSWWAGWNLSYDHCMLETDDSFFTDVVAVLRNHPSSGVII